MGEAISVLWSAAASADDTLVRLVAEDRAPESIVVVTSDRQLARRVGEAGAGTEGAGTFRRRMQAAGAINTA